MVDTATVSHQLWQNIYEEYSTDCNAFVYDQRVFLFCTILEFVLVAKLGLVYLVEIITFNPSESQTAFRTCVNGHSSLSFFL